MFGGRARRYRAVAFGSCPQRPSHSLFLGGQQMPIEARMAGMFGSFVIAAAYGWAASRGRAVRQPGRSMTLVLVGFIALTPAPARSTGVGADGVNSLLFPGWGSAGRCVFPINGLNEVGPVWQSALCG